MVAAAIFTNYYLVKTNEAVASSLCSYSATLVYIQQHRTCRLGLTLTATHRTCRLGLTFTATHRTCRLGLTLTATHRACRLGLTLTATHVGWD